MLEDLLLPHLLQSQLKDHLMHADLLNGSVTTIVMTTTTMKNVDGMVEIAVGTMSTHNTAQPVNA
jgi:hypothetical protein